MVKVIWKSYHKPEILDRGYWDQALLEDTFKRGDFSHQLDFDNLEDGEGAIVIINGRCHIGDAEKINADISKLRWVLFILTGDEEALFPWRAIQHSNMRFWVQLPRIGLHDDANYRIPNGYRPATHEILKEIGQQGRDLGWFFAGQVNHERRQQCVEELRKLPNGVLAETDGFGKEVVAYKDYLSYMSRSKIVFCPSGIETPDNFRLYEALEAGCLPVVDAFATKNPAWGFWKYLFEDAPFPVIDYWSNLPQLLPQLLKEYPTNANSVFAWWIRYKRNLYLKLMEDVETLRG
jgi:hypothetical protein